MKKQSPATPEAPQTVPFRPIARVQPGQPEPQKKKPALGLWTEKETRSADSTSVEADWLFP